MTTVHRHILFLFALGAAIVCQAQQWHTHIDVLQPAQLEFPRKISNLLIVNNTAPLPDNIGHITKVPSGNTVKKEEVSIDLSRAPFLCLIGMAETMEESERFASVSILEISQNKSKQPYARTMLTRAEVDSLCRYYGADAILALNQSIIYDVYEYFVTEDNGYYAYLNAYQNTSWSVQYPDGNNTFTYNRSDTLLWEAEGVILEKTLRQLPDRQTALLDMSRYVGEKTADMFLPQWETQDRYCYENKDENIRKGLEAFTHYRTAEAIEAWTAAYKTEGTKKKAKTTRAYAAANLSLLYELQGDINKAIDWARKSAEQFKTINTSEGAQQYANMCWMVELLKKEAR